jgi:hemerythrin-like domain-containing protein
VGPIELLAREHHTIVEVAAVLLRELEGPPAAPPSPLTVAREAVEFLKRFGDLHHHAIEERHVFPAIIVWGSRDNVSLVEQLLDEHVRLRGLLRNAAGDLALLGANEPVPPSALRRRLHSLAVGEREHCRKEDARLLSAVGDSLPPSAMTGLQNALEQDGGADGGRATLGQYPALARAVAASRAPGPAAGSRRRARSARSGGAPRRAPRRRSGAKEGARRSRTKSSR